MTGTSWHDVGNLLLYRRLGDQCFSERPHPKKISPELGNGNRCQPVELKSIMSSYSVKGTRQNAAHRKQKQKEAIDLAY
jgi:hypothetical protein